ncbi:hypothetical protein QJS04_geneDACA009413 [Acorus gramineus]|uniref:Uncharacterized protein n=1 Tax=Acorus gramineus TaxID=55184 RepID=A0AAV9AH47_ACOGR|nr:hypothetical protein QJS04_geneDACA009413 [Acorus gramineus]
MRGLEGIRRSKGPQVGKKGGSEGQGHYSFRWWRTTARRRCSCAARRGRASATRSRCRSSDRSNVRARIEYAEWEESRIAHVLGARHLRRRPRRRSLAGVIPSFGTAPRSRHRGCDGGLVERRRLLRRSRRTRRSCF